MLENFTTKFKKKGKKEQLDKSKDAAKERLHLVLMQDRANVSADFLDMMKQEIVDVIKKYIDVDETEMDVKLTNKSNDDGTSGAPALYANIPIVGINEEKKKESLELSKMQKAENDSKSEEQLKEEKDKSKQELDSELDEDKQSEEQDTQDSKKKGRATKTTKSTKTATKKSTAAKKTVSSKTTKKTTKTTAKTTNSKTRSSKSKEELTDDAIDASADNENSITKSKSSTKK